MTAIDVPKDYTLEQLTEALRALGLDHLLADTERKITLRALHITPEGMEVQVLTPGPPFGNDAPTVTARIGMKHPERDRKRS